MGYRRVIITIIIPYMGYNPMKTIDISPTKTIVIGVMCTNLAIDRGHHLVYTYLSYILHEQLK